MTNSRRIYTPTILDIIDPCVVRGRAIRPGATVRIIAVEKRGSRVFYYVQDNKRNVQSVLPHSVRTGE